MNCNHLFAAVSFVDLFLSAANLLGVPGVGVAPELIAQQFGRRDFIEQEKQDFDIKVVYDFKRLPEIRRFIESKGFAFIDLQPTEPGFREAFVECAYLRQVDRAKSKERQKTLEAVRKVFAIAESIVRVRHVYIG